MPLSVSYIIKVYTLEKIVPWTKPIKDKSEICSIGSFSSKVQGPTFKQGYEISIYTCVGTWISMHSL